MRHDGWQSKHGSARRLCGLTLHELGESVGGMKIDAVSKAIRRLEQQAVEENVVRVMQQRIIEMSNAMHIYFETGTDLNTRMITMTVEAPV